MILVFEWSITGPVATGLATVAAAILVVLVALYAAKCLHHPQAVASEFAHPVAGPTMAVIPL